MKNVLGITLLSLSSLCISGALSADQTQASVEKGAAHYRIFCINCHGEQADGKGPLVNLLKIKPSDLTTLGSTLQGETILERVVRAVDGRHKVGEGGERNMPVFSDNLAITTVYELAAFIEAIQQ
jgi:mono/diheme cytochrome c family protein